MCFCCLDYFVCTCNRCWCRPFFLPSFVWIWVNCVALLFGQQLSQFRFQFSHCVRLLTLAVVLLSLITIIKSYLEYQIFINIKWKRVRFSFAPQRHDFRAWHYYFAKYKDIITGHFGRQPGRIMCSHFVWARAFFHQYQFITTWFMNANHLEHKPFGNFHCALNEPNTGIIQMRFTEKLNKNSIFIFMTRFE